MRSVVAKPSLQRQVSWSLSAAIAGAGALAAAVSYGIAVYETNEMQDAQLQQIAVLLARQPSLSASGFYDAKDSEDAEMHLVVKRLDTSEPVRDPMTDIETPPGLASGFHTLDQSGVEWRVLVAATPRGERFAVAQRMTVRDELAQTLAAVTLLPLLLLVPLLLFVLRAVLRRAFRPLARLSGTVDDLGEQSLSPLATADVPSEVSGLVQAVNRLLDRLGRTLAQQRRLISDAAHELRTPVTALLVQGRNLENADLPAAARDRLAPLLQGLARMAALLEQLLGLARLQGAPSATRAEVDVRNVVRGVVESMLPMAEAKRVDLGCVRLEDCAVDGDAMSLMALVRNAVDNAVKYTAPGGSVDVSAYRDGPAVLFVVEDTGPGIPDAERLAVFEPFVRLLGTQEVGSGLGLAIARTAAVALGGHITLADRLDGASGLRFTYVQAAA